MAYFPRLPAWNKWLPSLLVATGFLQLASAQSCFLPNGTDRNSLTGLSFEVYRPSAYSKGDGYQMCCATNRDGYDTPRPDGLCQNGKETWRESCTDKTWESPSCLKLCVNGTDEAGQPMVDNDEHITVCPDNSYCCGINSTACCDQRKGVWIDNNGTVTAINPNATEPAPANNTSSDSSGTTSLVPPPSPSPLASGGLGGGALAGIVIGAIAAVAIMAAAGWFVRSRKRRTTKDRELDESTSTLDATSESTAGAGPLPEKDSGVPRSELDARALPAEMSASTMPHELPGSRVQQELQS